MEEDDRWREKWIRERGRKKIEMQTEGMTRERRRQRRRRDYTTPEEEMEGGERRREKGERGKNCMINVKAGRQGR